MYDAKRKGSLTGEALHAYYSPYIMGGNRQDQIEIDQIDVDGKVVTARCRFVEYFTSPTDTSFHLSVQRSIDFLTQVACTHALYLDGRTRKDVEIWMPDIQMTLTRPVRDPKNIPIRMELFARSGNSDKAKPFTFYKWKFDVGEGSWWGVVTYCLPIG